MSTQTHLRAQYPYQLTPRELEITAFMANGLSTKQIAYKLFVSVKTVETHRRNIYSKLSVHNLADVVQIALARGIVQNRFYSGEHYGS